MSARPDVLMATGRSDYPNQINNVIGFPYIFRGALDTQAKAINEEMKIAAVHAIANLAKQPVPDVVNSIPRQQPLFRSGILHPETGRPAPHHRSFLCRSQSSHGKRSGTP